MSASNAAKNFGSLVERVRDERAEYVVERGGVPVARIAPVVRSHCTMADLADVIRSRGRLDESYLKAVEAGVAFWNEPAIPGTSWER